MASINEQIADAALVIVNTGRPGDIPEITRTYLAAVDLDSGKHVSLYQSLTKPITDPRHGDPVVRYATFLRFKLGAKGTGSTRPDEEVDALFVWVVKQLSGKSQPGLYHALKRGEYVPDYEQADHGYCMASLDIIAEHQTRADDPEQWA